MKAGLSNEYAKINEALLYNFRRSVIRTRQVLWPEPRRRSVNDALKRK